MHWYETPEWLYRGWSVNGPVACGMVAVAADRRILADQIRALDITSANVGGPGSRSLALLDEVLALIEAES